LEGITGENERSFASLFSHGSVPPALATPTEKKWIQEETKFCSEDSRAWAAGVTQAVECLFCKCKVPSSHPSPTKKIGLFSTQLTSGEVRLMESSIFFMKKTKTNKERLDMVLKGPRMEVG
jgi:hypothetical protein